MVAATERATATKDLFKAARLDQRFALVPLVRAVGLDFDARYFREIAVRDWPREPEYFSPEVYRATAAHRAESDPTKVACYPTRADARRGREVVMSAGKFFAAVYPQWAPAQVQERAERYALAGSEAALKFATTAEEWITAYASARGFSSCMEGEECVRVYAYPDNGLALAYMEFEGETIARCIVNTERKLYVRVYGDCRIKYALEALGYSHDGRRALSGVKLRAIYSGGDLVMPYLDAVGAVEWNGRDDYCVVTEGGNYSAQSTGGYAEPAGEPCADCGDRMHEDDRNYIEREDVYVCDSCVQHNFTYAIVGRHDSREYIRDSEVITINGVAYIDDPDTLSYLGFVLDNSEEWIDADDAVFLEYLGEYAHIDNCTRLDIETDDGDGFALDDDVKTVIIDGCEQAVLYSWNGITDETRAQVRAQVRAQAGSRAFSRGPGRRNRAARSQRIARRIARKLETLA